MIYSWPFKKIFSRQILVLKIEHNLAEKIDFLPEKEIFLKHFFLALRELEISGKM